MAIASDKPSLTCLVPATMNACIASPLWETTDFSSLKILLTGSTAVPNQLSEAWREKGVAVLEMYGTTETCPIAIYQRYDSDFSKTGSTGKPALHCQVLIVDNNGRALPPGHEGEVVIKGPNVMLEYWGNDAATADALRNGWYSTGDIGMEDDDGYFYIRDRKKNMILSGGENIYPAEVERVLYAHPAVEETAVIGVPDEKWQEAPMAVVVLKPDSAVTAADLIAFMSGELANFKVPRRIVFTDSLPKNAMGKIQHFRVKKQFSGL
jgi:fatty-acyl-CoA synthase